MCSSDLDLVGYACWGPTPGTQGTYDLYWIVVDPTWQGKGVGTQLLDAVERALLGAEPGHERVQGREAAPTQ